MAEVLIHLSDEVRFFFQEIKDLYRETDRLMKEQSRETSAKFQETERLMKEQSKETSAKFQETSAKFQETSAKFQETIAKFQETERLMKEQSMETERLLKEQSKETKQLIQKNSKETTRIERMFVSQWGKLVESLVEGDIVNLLNGIGIPVKQTSTRLKGRSESGENYEFDIIAHNGKAIVVVEVKTMLKPQDVEDFIEKLDCIKSWVTGYAGNVIHGAMAYLKAEGGSEVMAQKRGLLIIRATGNSAAIVNEPDFTPKAW